MHLTGTTAGAQKNRRSAAAAERRTCARVGGCNIEEGQDVLHEALLAHAPCPLHHLLPRVGVHDDDRRQLDHTVQATLVSTRCRNHGYPAVLARSVDRSVATAVLARSVAVSQSLPIMSQHMHRITLVKARIIYISENVRSAKMLFVGLNHSTVVFVVDQVRHARSHRE